MTAAQDAHFLVLEPAPQEGPYTIATALREISRPCREAGGDTAQIGWGEVRVSPAEHTDPRFADVSERLRVLHLALRDRRTAVRAYRAAFLEK